MKLKEILKLIYRTNIKQQIKFYITTREGMEVEYAANCCEAFNIESVCQDYEVVGLEAEQMDDENLLCISIENFDC